MKTPLLASYFFIIFIVNSMANMDDIVQNTHDTDDEFYYSQMPLASDVQEFHATLLQRVMRLPSVEEKVDLYITAALELFTLTNGNRDLAKYLVKVIFKDLQKYSRGLLHQIFESFPYKGLPLNLQHFSDVKDVFVNMSSLCTNRKRSLNASVEADAVDCFYDL